MGGERSICWESLAEHFVKAVACAPSVAWLRTLIPSAEGMKDTTSAYAEEFLQSNVEKIELTFERRGFASPKKFEKEAKFILDGLASMDSKEFEEAHRRLGELLGFDAGNSDSDAAPDPWWISAGKMCIVSEDKSDSKPDNPVAVKHVRQAVTHPKWIAEHVPMGEKPIVSCVMITPATSIHPEAATFADDLKYWQIDEFRKWANRAIAKVRELRNEYPGPGNFGWRVLHTRVLLSDAEVRTYHAQG